MSSHRRAALAAMAGVALHTAACLVAMAHPDRVTTDLFAIWVAFALALTLIVRYYREEWRT